MNTVKIGSLIRKTLSKAGLPLHYFIKYYVFAIDGLTDLQLSILPCEKTAELILDDRKEATLPEDYVGEVAVYKAEGDKLIEMPHNNLISSFDNTDPFESVDDSYYTGDSVPMYMDEFRTDVGRQFGQVYPRNDGYRIIPELNKIRINLNSTLTKVYLKYVSLPQKVNGNTLIHPYIEPALVAYINWQVAMYAGARDTMIKRQEYYNQRRLAKANFNRINISDILSSFRQYHHQGVKI